MTRNQDCTENCFDPGVRHSGRSSLSGGGGHHFYLAVGVQEFRPFMNGSCGGHEFFMSRCHREASTDGYP